jgi:hypothetical protein
MPRLVLVAGQRVQVDDRVEAFVGTQLHGPVEVSEALLADRGGCIVVLEMPVVDRDADRVHAQAAQERRIVPLEEDLEEALEEGFREAIAEDRADGGPVVLLARGIAGDEVLHVQPAAQADAAQSDGRPDRVHDRRSEDPKWWESLHHVPPWLAAGPGSREPRWACAPGPPA